MSWYVHGNGLHDGGFHVLLLLGHKHVSLVRVHWHGHVYDVWIAMWAEHDLIPSLWGFCITLVLATPLHFYVHCMVIGYVLGVREDRPDGAYSSMVLWLECREHRLEDGWTRAIGSWMGLGSRLSYVGPKNRYMVILVLALLYVVGVTCFACACGV